MQSSRQRTTTDTGASGVGWRDTLLPICLTVESGVATAAAGCNDFVDGGSCGQVAGTHCSTGGVGRLFWFPSKSRTFWSRPRTAAVTAFAMSHSSATSFTSDGSASRANGGTSSLLRLAHLSIPPEPLPSVVASPCWSSELKPAIVQFGRPRIRSLCACLAGSVRRRRVGHAVGLCVRVARKARGPCNTQRAVRWLCGPCLRSDAAQQDPPC